VETVSIRYIVDDVDAAVDFYREDLDFAVQLQPGPGFAVLSRGGLRLLLNAPGAGGAGTATPEGEPPRPGGWARFQLVTDDLDGLTARLQQRGAVFRLPVTEGRGGRQALVEDPAGNPVELFEPYAATRQP
jgi:predicted enzyme related to lactoylglutathione lyase